MMQKRAKHKRSSVHLQTAAMVHRCVPTTNQSVYMRCSQISRQNDPKTWISSFFPHPFSCSSRHQLANSDFHCFGDRFHPAMLRSRLVMNCSVPSNGLSKFLDGRRKEGVFFHFVRWQVLIGDSSAPKAILTQLIGAIMTLLTLVTEA